VTHGHSALFIVTAGRGITLVELADLLRQQRHQCRSRWRRLDSGRQALLVQVIPRPDGRRCRRCAGARGASTVWRYIGKAVGFLADPRRRRRRSAGGTAAFAVHDSALAPIDLVADRKPFYSGCEVPEPENGRVDGRPGTLAQ
jgi:hypothetical protein